MERDQASQFINDLLKLMVSRGGSDLFITADFPPAIKVDGKVTKVSQQPLGAQHTLALTRSVMNDRQMALDLFDAFGSPEKTLQANMGGHTGVPAYAAEDAARFFARHLRH